MSRSIPIITLLSVVLTLSAWAGLQTRPPGLDPAGVRLAQLDGLVAEAEGAIADNRLTLRNAKGPPARELLDRVLRTDPFNAKGLAAMGRLITALITHAKDSLKLNPPQPETAREYWRKARDLAIRYRVEQAGDGLDGLLAAIEAQEREQAAAKLEDRLNLEFATERETLEQTNKRLREQLAKGQAATSVTEPSQLAFPPVAPRLRPTPSKKVLSYDEVKQAFQRLDLWSKNANSQGKGYPNQFERKGKVVIDHASGLMWEQSGSPDPRTYQQALAYVKKLQDEEFAGYKDWRLPTIEELGSLLETSKLNGDLYIDPVFDKTQPWIWSADSDGGSSAAWRVSFDDGDVYWNVPVIGGRWVRACRSSG
jgi:hypothetical protein